MMALVAAILAISQSDQKFLEVSLVVAVQPDATAEQLDELKARFEHAAKSWWKCTEGHMAFTSIKIVDRTEDGDVIVANLDSPFYKEGLYGLTSGKKVYLGGRFPIVTFCHEMGHRWFELPDEYREPKCGHCVMEPWKGIFAFCDGRNHTARGADCWSRIVKKYPEWKRREKFDDCPAVKITVENR